MSYNLPKPFGPDWKIWGHKLIDSLTATRSQLAYYVAGDSAATDGVFLFDAEGYPVISKNSEFKQLLVEGGCGQFYATATQTASQANTATAVNLNASTVTDGLAINGSDATKIDVTEAGLLRVSITAQATASGSHTAHLWVSVNGTDGYAVKKVISGDDTISHTALLTVAAGNHLKIMYAVSNTGLTLPNTAASSPLPAVPAVQITIDRIRQ